MPYNESNGNMYPWVDGNQCHHRGRCPHGCTYCYVQHMRCARFYQGPIRLVEQELREDLYKFGRGKTIFIDHMIDLFADDIPTENIEKVLAHCREYPENTYVLQTKNPKRMITEFYLGESMPKNVMLGTTIETNRASLLREYGQAPDPHERALYLGMPSIPQTFVTIEPIMKFNLHELTELIRLARPTWVNIGADSKNQHLPEPTWEAVVELAANLRGMGVGVRHKSNLERLRPPGSTKAQNVKEG